MKLTEQDTEAHVTPSKIMLHGCIKEIINSGVHIQYAPCFCLFPPQDKPVMLFTFTLKVAFVVTEIHSQEEKSPCQMAQVLLLAAMASSSPTLTLWPTREACV